MKARTVITTLFASALMLAPLAGIAQGNGAGRGGNDQAKDRAQVERGQRDFDRGRLRDRDRTTVPSHDRDRIQDRTKAPETAPKNEDRAYGNETMTEQERNAYGEQARNENSAEDAEQIKARHRHEEQVKAEAQGV